MNYLKNGTRIQMNGGSPFPGLQGIICGRSTQDQPVIGPSYIIEPDDYKEIYSEEYPHTHFCLFQSEFDIIEVNWIDGDEPECDDEPLLNLTSELSNTLPSWKFSYTEDPVDGYLQHCEDIQEPPTLEGWRNWFLHSVEMAAETYVNQNNV